MSSPALETPPRTWRRLGHQERRHQHVGNTSTDVEKTAPARPRSPDARKHLHGRGEDLRCISLIWNEWETPPRTWRRQPLRKLTTRAIGNTSTDVEKTVPSSCADRPDWKHLHGRGEDVASAKAQRAGLETPPRTWRRLDDLDLTADEIGNTSTDVEKTYWKEIVGLAV